MSPVLMRTHTRTQTLAPAKKLQPAPAPDNQKHANQTCTGAVLSEDAQMESLYKAQSAYFMSVVMCQFATAHVCKFRKGLPWGSRFLM